MNKPTLDQLIAIEDAALKTYFVYRAANPVGATDSAEYTAYKEACYAVNRAKRELIAAENAAFLAWMRVAEHDKTMQRFESDEYKAYIRAVKAVNKARGN